MYSNIRFISACLALSVLISCTTAHKDEGTFASQQNSTQTVKVESPEETRLRIGPGDPVAGMEKTFLCQGCHGEDGISFDTRVPKLAGQYGSYISKQVRNYLSGLLPHEIMGSMAGTVSDEDLNDIAAYFASQPMMRGNVASDNKLGKQLYYSDDSEKARVSCNSCHGVYGKGLSPENPVYPVIGGQHRDYLYMQLLKFKNGERNNSPGGMMNTSVHRLSNAELEALADYISGL